MYLILGILCTWYTLYLVYLVPVSCIWSILYLDYLYLLPGLPFTLYWCTLYLVYSVPGVPCSWCTLYLVYLKHLMTWFLCTKGLEGLGDMRHDLVQHPEYHDVIIMLPKYDDKSCPLIWRKDLYLLHKTMQRWMYWRSRTPTAKLAARITAIRIKSRCSLHLHKCQIFAAWLTIIINQDNLNFLKNSHNSQRWSWFLSIVNHDHLNVLKHEDDSDNVGRDEYELNWHPVQGLPLDLSGCWLLLRIMLLMMLAMMTMTMTGDNYDDDELLCRSVSPSAQAGCPPR